MTNTYYSIVKFTDAVLKKYPNAGTIILPFVPERQNSDRHDKYYIEPIAVIIKHNSNDKPTVLSCETMFKTFGNPVIKITETNHLKINFRAEMQALKISTELPLISSILFIF